MGLGVAVEVPFASEARPSGKDRQGKHLAGAERRFGARSLLCGRMRLAEVIQDNVECGEEGVHVEHEESVPFPWGLVGKPTVQSADTFRSNFAQMIHTKRLTP